MEDQQRWLAPSEASHELRVSTQTVLNMVKDGRLRGWRSPRGHLIAAESVHALAVERAQAKETTQQA